MKPLALILGVLTIGWAALTGSMAIDYLRFGKPDDVNVAFVWTCASAALWLAVRHLAKREATSRS
jgi:hypothetical protein